MKINNSRKKNSLYSLVFDYMLTNPIFKLSVVPIFFLTYIALKLHNNIIESVTHLENYVVSNTKNQKLEMLIVYHVGFLFGHYLYTFAYISLIAFFINNNFTVAFGDFTKKYLAIKYAEFHNMGSGKIRSLILRRSHAVTTLAKIFMEHIYVGGTYLINNHIFLYSKFGLKVMLWNTLMYLFFIMFYLFVSPFVKNVINRNNKSYNSLSNKIFEIISNYDMIKASNSDDYELGKLDEYLKDYEKQSYNSEVVLSVSKWLHNNGIMFLNAGMVFMAVYGIEFESLSSHSAMALYNKTFSTTLRKLEQIGLCIPYFIEQSAIFEFDCLEGCGLDDDETGLNVVGFKHNIEFRNFGLIINEKVLLSNVFFEVNKGEKVAIFGENGCGKSSILKTLLKFTNYEGDIFIDGNNAEDISVKSQRFLNGYIPQNPHIMEGTVLENIKYGNEEVSNNTVIDLCETYKTHDIFKHFENGYSTNVGESGKFLSGGQKQQLSFMRAVVKDSDIYLIDEPTSNLDKRAEDEMLNLIFEKMSQKTVLAILHNPKSLQRFDKILGIRDGKVYVYTSYKDFLQDGFMY